MRLEDPDCAALGLLAYPLRVHDIAVLHANKSPTHVARAHAASLGILGPTPQAVHPFRKAEIGVPQT